MKNEPEYTERVEWQVELRNVGRAWSKVAFSGSISAKETAAIFQSDFPVTANNEAWRVVRVEERRTVELNFSLSTP